MECQIKLNIPVNLSFIDEFSSTKDSPSSKTDTKAIDINSLARELLNSRVGSISTYSFTLIHIIFLCQAAYKEQILELEQKVASLEGQLAQLNAEKPVSVSFYINSPFVVD
jgi:hypothetical protein